MCSMTKTGDFQTGGFLPGYIAVLCACSFVITTATPNITLHVLVDNFSSMTVTYSPTDLDLLYTTVYLFDLGTLYVNQCPHVVQPGVCKFEGRDPDPWLSYIPKSLYRFMLMNGSEVMHDEVVNTADHVKVAHVSRAQVYNIDSRSADVRWGHEIRSEPLIYRITLLNSSGFVLRSHVTHNNRYHLDDLLPHHNYSVSIIAKTEDAGFWSDEDIQYLTTLQDVPSSGPDIIPGGFQYQVLDSSRAQVTVYWNTAPARHRNGRLLSHAGYDLHTGKQVFKVAAGYSAASFEVPTDQPSTIAIVSSTSAGYGSLDSASLVEVPPLKDVPECEGIVYVLTSSRNLVSVDINMECWNRNTGETLVIQDYQVMHCEQTEPGPECFRQVTVSEMFALHRKLTRAMTLEVQDARNVVVGVSLRVKVGDSLPYVPIKWSDCVQDPALPPVPPMNLAALSRGGNTVTLKWQNPDCGALGSTYAYVINTCDITACGESLRQVQVYRNRKSYDIDRELRNGRVWMHSLDMKGRRSENTTMVELQTFQKVQSTTISPAMIAASMTAALIFIAVIVIGAICLRRSYHRPQEFNMPQLYSYFDASIHGNLSIRRTARASQTSNNSDVEQDGVHRYCGENYTQDVQASRIYLRMNRDSRDSVVTSDATGSTDVDSSSDNRSEASATGYVDNLTSRDIVTESSTESMYTTHDETASNCSSDVGGGYLDGRLVDQPSVRQQ